MKKLYKVVKNFTTDNYTIKKGSMLEYSPSFNMYELTNDFGDLIYLRKYLVEDSPEYFEDMTEADKYIEYLISWTEENLEVPGIIKFDIKTRSFMIKGYRRKFNNIGIFLKQRFREIIADEIIGKEECPYYLDQWGKLHKDKPEYGYGHCVRVNSTVISEVQVVCDYLNLFMK